MEFILRPFELRDIPNMVRYADNPKIAGNLTDAFPHPYTWQAAEKFINMAMGHNPAQIRVIDIDSELCGAIGLHPQSDVYKMNAEMGYWLAEPFWGNGIMSKAIEQTIKYGFENFSFTRIYARPFGSNVASQKALEKAGMKKEAVLQNAFFKNGKYEDEWIYSVSIV